MPLVYTGITPHTPLLIENISKDNYLQLEKTITSLKLMEQELYARMPQTLIIISSHPHSIKDSFTVEYATHQHINNKEFQLSGDFKEFGEYSTSVFAQSNIDLSYALIEYMHNQNIVVHKTVNQSCDYSISTPLYYLTQHLKNISVIVINYSRKSEDEHVEFGKHLHDFAQKSKERIAIITSAELSHNTQVDESLDRDVRTYLKEKDTLSYKACKNLAINDHNYCGYYPLLIFFGIMENHIGKYKELSYESPFGVGLLTAEYTL